MFVEIMANYAAGSIRVVMAMRFQALITVMAHTRCASSSGSKCALASSQTARGTCWSAIKVTASVSASAARS